MESNKTKYFLVGCATIMVGIIVSFIILGGMIGLIALAYARRGDAGAVSTIIACLFILIVLFSVLWRK